MVNFFLQKNDCNINTYFIVTSILILTPHLFNIKKALINGGESGIRTHDTIARIHTFQACAFNRSAISPI